MPPTRRPTDDAASGTTGGSSCPHDHRWVPVAPVNDTYTPSLVAVAPFTGWVPSHTSMPSSLMTRGDPYSGTATVAVVPDGAPAWIANPPGSVGEPEAPHCTSTGPFGVGTRPSTQLRLPGCGSMSAVVYPGAVGVTPSAYCESAEVAPLLQPCAALSIAVRLPSGWT